MAPLLYRAAITSLLFSHNRETFRHASVQIKSSTTTLLLFKQTVYSFCLPVKPLLSIVDCIQQPLQTGSVVMVSKTDTET